MHLPMLWWTHFNNVDGTLFSKKRGKNFFGVQSKLTNLYLLTLKDNDHIHGAVPLASYTIKLPNKQDDYQLLSFAGDYVTAINQDLLVDPDIRGEAIDVILAHIIQEFSQTHDLIILGYIAEHSENLPYIKQFLTKKIDYHYQYIEAFTARRGGIWPWTIVSFKRIFDSILTKVDEGFVCYKEINNLSEKLSKATPLTLLFPRNRLKIMASLEEVVQSIKNNKLLENERKDIIELINPSLITYPYISLPHDRETYFKSLSKSKRYYYRRYYKKFLHSGGSFEKLTGHEIRESDIDDCFRLHLMRWGKESAILSSDDAIKYQKHIAMTMAKEGFFTIFFSTFNGERIAAHTCFDINNRREFYMPGRNPKYEKLRAGSILLMETILDAIDCNYEIYDLGVVGFDYKMDFTKTAYRTKNFFIFKENSRPDLEMIYNGFEYMML
jgi:hypothetical protein